MARLRVLAVAARMVAVFRFDVRCAVRVPVFLMRLFMRGM